MKKSSNWYIAATHFLTAGFAFPIIGAIVVFALLALTHLQGIAATLIAALFGLGFLYVGLIYSAKYIHKTYVITNAANIVILATTYAIVIKVVFTALGIYMVVSKGTLDLTGTLFNVTVAVINIALFYFISKQKIKNNA